VVVEFDGMGPTWTVLVQKGLELFPNATHGVLSDADFTPTITWLDKRQLKMECSKHMYKIRSMDGGTVRNTHIHTYTHTHTHTHVICTRSGQWTGARYGTWTGFTAAFLQLSVITLLIISHNTNKVRNMDWIYRNIPGAKVERRTHQSLNVPEIPGQSVYQTLIGDESKVLK
jgi:hypothetical protein